MPHRNLNKEYDVPKGTHLQLCHLHIGNTTEEERKGKSYITIAKLVRDNTEIVLAKATATCSPRDTPTRKRGRDIACKRVVSYYRKAQPE